MKTFQWDIRGCNFLVWKQINASLSRPGFSWINYTNPRWWENKYIRAYITQIQACVKYQKLNGSTHLQIKINTPLLFMIERRELTIRILFMNKSHKSQVVLKQIRSGDANAPIGNLYHMLAIHTKNKTKSLKNAVHINFLIISLCFVLYLHK